MSSSPAAAATMFTEIATGWHVLTVENYSQMRGRFGVARRLKSWPFVVGGHTWCITFFPDGLTEDTADWISFALRQEQHRAGVGGARDAAAAVTVRSTFSLLDDGGRPAVPSHTVSCGVWTFSRSCQSWSHPRFMERKELESSPYMKDDGFRVRCDVTVLSSSSSAAAAAPPPANLFSWDLGELLASGDGADVTLDVSGESFRAHKNILAASSPVFKAQFFGGPPYAENAASRVRIDGIEPSVFRALLHYMYTDSLLPEIDDNGGDDDRMAMAQHLLVAADRYGLERLKSACELALVLTVGDVSAVVTTLVLAEQHGCHHLKEACIKVLKSSKGNNSYNYKERVVGEDFQYLA